MVQEAVDDGRRARLGRRCAPVVLVVVAALAWADGTGRVDVQAWSRAVLGGRTDVPSPGFEASGTVLGSPPATPGTSDSYGFMATHEDGTPVAYDPCRPVHLVVREAGAPPGGRRLLLEAVARVSAATGLRFVDDGTTTEAPSDDRAAFQPDRYGDRWAPVLVAWSTPDEQPDLTGDVAGQAGSVRTSRHGGPTVYVTGQVELDGPQLQARMARPSGEAVVRGVIEHELGHLVGLDHVDDPTQLMYPRTTAAVTDYADGDLEGLARLGRGVCDPDL